MRFLGRHWCVEGWIGDQLPWIFLASLLQPQDLTVGFQLAQRDFISCRGTQEPILDQTPLGRSADFRRACDADRWAYRYP